MQQDPSRRNPFPPGLILALCFATYLTVYLLRTNYSAAMPLMLQQLPMNEFQLGIVSSAFFISYAAGQLVNGFIADAVNPGKFIIIALVGAITMNAAMAASHSLWALTAVWTCNGYCQSIFWGCLQRILSLHYGREKRTMVATTMSASMVAGFILSWVVLRNFLQGHSWQSFFLFPAFGGAILLMIWILVCRRVTASVPTSRALSPKNICRALRLMAEKRLFLLCVICLSLGFIKESISVWGPTMIAQIMGIDLQTSSVILLIIPLGNLAGIFWAKYLADKIKTSTIRTLIPLFSIIAGASILLLLVRDHMLLTTAALMVIVSAMSYGCNSVLLSMIPLLYTRYGIVSTLIGFFDFSSYIGASVSSVVAGILFAAGSWKLLPMLWLLAAAAALIFALLAEKITKQV